MNRRSWLLVALALTPMARYIHAQTNPQARQLADAEAKWTELGATSYKYKLRVGGVFGVGEYRVEVRGSDCTSKHVGGMGLGHAKLLERFRSEPTCDGRLIGELLKNVQFDVARGFTLTDMGVDPRYGFLTKAYLDTSRVEDQEWGFEIIDFEVLGAGRKGT